MEISRALETIATYSFHAFRSCTKWARNTLRPRSSGLPNMGFAAAECSLTESGVPTKISGLWLLTSAVSKICLRRSKKPWRSRRKIKGRGSNTNFWRIQQGLLSFDPHSHVPLDNFFSLVSALHYVYLVGVRLRRIESAGAE